MYVCVCSGITQKQVQEAVAQGATTTEDLRDMLNVGANCGSCLPAAENIVNSAITTHPPSMTARNGLFYAV